MINFATINNTRIIIGGNIRYLDSDIVGYIEATNPITVEMRAVPSDNLMGYAEGAYWNITDLNGNIASWEVLCRTTTSCLEESIPPHQNWWGEPKEKPMPKEKVSEYKFKVENERQIDFERIARENPNAEMIIVFSDKDDSIITLMVNTAFQNKYQIIRCGHTWNVAQYTCRHAQKCDIYRYVCLF